MTLKYKDNKPDDLNALSLIRYHCHSKLVMGYHKKCHSRIHHLALKVTNVNPVLRVFLHFHVLISWRKNPDIISKTRVLTFGRGYALELRNNMWAHRVD